MKKMKINIAHLYPEQLNLYGDKGNILTLERRLKLRGIECEVKEYAIGDKIDFENTDILLLGGGGEREISTVENALLPQAESLKNYIENNGSVIAICEGFELLGNGHLNIIDISVQKAKKRTADDIVIESDIISSTIVGFENHKNNIDIKGYTPLGKVKYGIGNSADTGNEGMIYKNLICTNIYGPVLPKNPKLADYIIKCALDQKSDAYELIPIDDELENMAHNYIVNRCENQK